MATIQEISQEALNKIQQRIDERKVRQKASEDERAARDKAKYINLSDGETVVLKFDVEKEAPRKEFPNKFGGTSKKTFYPVIDPNTGEDKVFSANDQTAEMIDVVITKTKKTILEITRKGKGTDTQYIVTPA